MESKEEYHRSGSFCCFIYMVHVRRTKDPTLTTPFTDNETLQNFYFTNIFQEANNGATDYRRQTLSLYTF